MSSREFAEWGEFAKLEPFGEVRADVRSAMICKVIADVNRGKGVKPYKVSDFMPRFEPESQSEEEMLQMVQTLNVALGGEDLREDDD